MRRSSESTTLSLFPEIGEIPADAVDSVQVKLSGMELRRPRAVRQLLVGVRAVAAAGTGRVLAAAIARRPRSGELGEGAAAAGGEPADRSGQRVSRASAMVRGQRHGRVAGRGFRGGGEGPAVSLSGPGAGAQAGAVRLACSRSGRICSHADFEVLLYDLTSTYFEGEMEQNPKAKRGYSRDGRPDCLQVVIALVVTPDGFPLAYEVMDGNTSDRTTLRGFLDKIENTYGKAGGCG